MGYIKMGRRFLCCNFGKDEESESDSPPSRPVEDAKAEQNKTAPKPNPSYPAVHPQGLSTETEKRDLFGPPESQPSSSQAEENQPIHATPTSEQSEGQRIVGPQDEEIELPSSEGSGSGIYIPAEDIHDSSSRPSAGSSEDKSNIKGKRPILEESPPPYHNWQDTVPDTSVFPPPPVNAFLFSKTGNASQDDADRAHDFCDNVPLWKPMKPSAEVYSWVQRNKLYPVRPHEYQGDLTVVRDGRWKGTTLDYNRDCILLTALPMYFAVGDSPLDTEVTKTIYFEVTLRRLHGTKDKDEPSLSIGYAAQPYPSWRFPGWERGSIGVCSDDGCRFVNDSFGGNDFTTPFKIGETVGLGMIFSVPNEEAATEQRAGKVPLAIEIFLTRNGEKTGSWNLHEEKDADSGSVAGLEGDYDLYGAVGIFGGVEFEVCFDPSGWKWKPSS